MECVDDPDKWTPFKLTHVVYPIGKNPSFTKHRPTNEISKNSIFEFQEIN